jgi:hypothetical protein
MGPTLRDPQAQQLVAALVQQRQAATPQNLANTLWAAATMGLTLPDQQAQQLVAALVQQRQAATPQNLSNTLWAAATMGLTLPDPQAQQLVEALVQQRQAASPQAVFNTLWAAATMRLTLSADSWHSMLAVLEAKAAEASPQAVANTLWAMATSKADFAAVWRTASQLRGAQLTLLQLADAAVILQLVEGMNAQEISNSLWALSDLGMRPRQLVTLLMKAALQQVAAMNPQEISNTALAAARLGLFHPPLFAALLAAAPEQRQGIPANPQHICNLCWAVAIADQRPLSQQVITLCEQLAASALWDGGFTSVGCAQLWQVHLWLLDCHLGGAGLADALSKGRLQRCAGEWEQSLQQTAQQRRTRFERSVFAIAQRLPCVDACSQEARTEDGAFSVDVAATHIPSGRRLAIEADGPVHFLLPGWQETGETLARNRALAARGYLVVSVPHWEWDALRGSRAREAYLQRKVEAALSRELGQGKGPTSLAARQ